MIFTPHMGGKRPKQTIFTPQIWTPWGVNLGFFTPQIWNPWGVNFPDLPPIWGVNPRKKSGSEYGGWEILGF